MDTKVVHVAEGDGEETRVEREINTETPEGLLVAEESRRVTKQD